MKFKVGFSLSNLFLIYLALCVSVSHAFSSVRVIIYTMLPLFMLGYFLLKRKPFNVKLISPVYQSIIIWTSILLGLFILNAGDFRITWMVKESLLILLGILTPYFLILVMKREELFFTLEQFFLLYGFLFMGLTLAGGDFNFNLINQIVYSQSSSESSSAFVLGLFASVFFIEKKYKFFLIAFFLTLLASKRIALVGVFACIGMSWVYHQFRVNERRFYQIGFPILIVTLNLVFVLLFYNLSIGAYDEWFLENLGLPPNRIFMGRIKMLSDMFRYLDSLPVFVGHGLGYTSYLLQENLIQTEAHLVLIHSDVIKFFIEIGLVPFSIILFILYRVAMKLKVSACLMIYLNVLMLTDNISIYLDIMVFFYLFFSGIYSENEIRFLKKSRT